MNLRVLLYWLLNISGINAMCRKLYRSKAIIIYYHGVCNDNFTLLKGYDERHTPKSLFRKQLAYLKRKGYIFVNMSELVDALNNKGNTDKYVTLTFDDGFQNVVENAYPIMKEFGARGCFYLVSSLTGTDRLLWTDFIETMVRNQNSGDFQFIYRGEAVHYRLEDRQSYEHAMKDIKAKLRQIPDRERLEHLKQFDNIVLQNVPREFALVSWEQIRELDPRVLEIGNHTRSHPNCVNLGADDELEDEIYNAKVDIQRNIGRKVDHFCYPAGSYNETVIAMAKKHGHESAVTTEEGFIDADSDVYKLKRIYSGADFLTFKAKISGSNNILRRIKMRFFLPELANKTRRRKQQNNGR
jgi:peptidoglycan/xylan/chitin deacetylase (PgdA/CDA1 family)